MSRPAPLASTTVGIVVERRKATSPWVDYVWRPVAALPGVPDTPPWTSLEGGDAQLVRLYAGSAEVDLYAADSPRYAENLASGDPCLWVIMRSTGGEPPYEIMMVTANPSEGEAFTESGSDLVEPVSMPEPIQEMLARFVAEHPVEETFFKRKRDRGSPDSMTRRRRGVRDGSA